MNCFFSHKFDRVQPDGFQYCSKCGEAKKPAIPHPCRAGHMWEDCKGEQIYIHTSFDYGKIQKYYIPQKCKICGERRGAEQYRR